MFPQTDRSWRDYRSLNQNWSYQPTLAGRAIYTKFSLLSGAMVYHERQINPNQNVIFIKPRNFDTADIKCFTVYVESMLI